jgi:hypothetical protein
MGSPPMFWWCPCCPIVLVFFIVLLLVSLYCLFLIDRSVSPNVYILIRSMIFHRKYLYFYRKDVIEVLHLLQYIRSSRGRRGRDHMVVRFTTIYVISANRH